MNIEKLKIYPKILDFEHNSGSASNTNSNIKKERPLSEIFDFKIEKVSWGWLIKQIKDIFKIYEHKIKGIPIPSKLKKNKQVKNYLEFAESHQAEILSIPLRLV